MRMNDYDPYEKMVGGLHAVAQEVGRFDAARKVLGMQDAYLEHNPSRYTEAQQAALVYFLRAHLYKAQVAQLYLEQLWSLHHAVDVDLLVRDVLINVCDEHEFRDQNLLLASHLLDGYLIQAKAAYDFMLLFFNAFLGFEPERHFNGQKLQKNIRSLVTDGHPYAPAALTLHTYIDEQLWNLDELTQGKWQKAWGKVIADLRNAMVHRDVDHPDFDRSLRLADLLLDTWPALDSITCSRFSQDIGNCQFEVWSELIPAIFDMPWMPGPYRDDLWNEPPPQ